MLFTFAFPLAERLAAGLPEPALRDPGPRAAWAPQAPCTAPRRGALGLERRGGKEEGIRARVLPHHGRHAGAAPARPAVPRVLRCGGTGPPPRRPPGRAIDRRLGRCHPSGHRRRRGHVLWPGRPRRARQADGRGRRAAVPAAGHPPGRAGAALRRSLGLRPGLPTGRLRPATGRGPGSGGGLRVGGRRGRGRGGRPPPVVTRRPPEGRAPGRGA